MTNYYETLKIQPSATLDEIEIAWEDRYNQVRRLVTHHDPNIVNQANQALALLEQIRSTLTDQDKRMVYDAAIGVSGQQFGGLADLDAIQIFSDQQSPLDGMVSPPPVPPLADQKAPPQQTLQRVDAWICPQCHTANAIGVKFCVKDGVQLGHPCPNCHRMAELITPFCPSCGVEKIKKFHEDIAEEISELQQIISQTNHSIEVYQKAGSAYTRYSLEKVEYERVFDELNSKKDEETGCFERLIILGIWGYGTYYLVYDPGLLYSQPFIGWVSLAIVILGPLIVRGLIKWNKRRNERNRIANEKIQEFRHQIASLDQKIYQAQNRVYPD